MSLLILSPVPFRGLRLLINFVLIIYLKVFLLWLVETWIATSPVCGREFFGLLLSNILFLVLGSFCSCVTLIIIQPKTQGYPSSGLQNSSSLSLFVAPSSVVLCCRKYSSLGLPEFSFLSPSTACNHQALFGSLLLLVLQSGNYLLAVIGGRCRALLVCFPSFTDFRTVLPIVHCLKPLTYYLVFYLFKVKE